MRWFENDVVITWCSGSTKLWNYGFAIVFVILPWLADLERCRFYSTRRFCLWIVVEASKLGAFLAFARALIRGSPTRFASSCVILVLLWRQLWCYYGVMVLSCVVMRYYGVIMYYYTLLWHCYALLWSYYGVIMVLLWRHYGVTLRTMELVWSYYELL